MEFTELRPHQQLGVQGLRDGWKSHKWQLLNASCGYGKTAVASYLCNMFAKAGMKTVFAAPYVSLVDQTWQRFQEYGMEPPSVIWQKDERHDKNKLVQIASADTLVARGRQKKETTVDAFGVPEQLVIPDDCKVFIWDECDLRRRGLIEALQDRPDVHVIGLTATPYAKWLGTYYTNFIKPCTTNELIEQKWLTGFDILHPDVGQSIHVMDGVKSRKSSYGDNDYATGEAAAAMMETKIVGKILSNWLENGQNLPTIGFAMNKESANAYCREFLAAGVSCAVVVDKTPRDERMQIYKDFANGILKVIWNVGVLGAGFDSDVRCVIWARPSKSERVWVQGAMRGSRPAKGKEECLLFDHTPTFFNLGAPNDIEYFELNDVSDGMEESIREAQEKRQIEAQSKVCGKCGHVKKPKEYKCTRCGHKPLGGEAAECDEAFELVRAKKEKTPKYSTEQKQQFYAECLGWIAQQREKGKNRSDGFAYHIFSDKFKHKPQGYPKKRLPPSPETVSYIRSRLIAFAKGKAKA